MCTESCGECCYGCRKISFQKYLILFFIFLYILVGACCGSTALDGCVDDSLPQDCSAPSQWTKDQLCSAVCGKCLIVLMSDFFLFNKFDFN